MKLGPKIKFFDIDEKRVVTRAVYGSGYSLRIEGPSEI